ncbi:MAG: fibronectin type III domain-containing protein, partial [Defluviitaleaceae bacterium]|nr:fibronectin type III domain-containing protein [Defluviitaleaceae bacterium]
GGTVTASARSGAGIGSGNPSGIGNVTSGGIITISGGTVTANGGSGAAGIGGGSGLASLESRGNGGTIIITGGTVTAIGDDGSTTRPTAAGIGDGRNGTGNDTTFEMSGGVVYASSITDTSPMIEYGILFTGVNGSRVGVDGTVYGDFILVDDFTLLGPTARQTLTVPENSSLTIPEKIEFTNNGILTNNGTVLNNGTVMNNGTFTNNETLNNQGIFINKGTFIDNGKIIGDHPVAEPVFVSTFSELLAATASGSQAALIVLSNNISSTNQLTISHSLTLDLNGHTLTINLPAEPSGNCISVQNNVTFTVMCSKGTGALNVTSAGISGNTGAGIRVAVNGTFIVRSGTITAVGGPYSAGIGGGRGNSNGTVIINGGTVTATGGVNGGAGIGGGGNTGGLGSPDTSGGDGGSVTINGGTVTATGGSGGDGTGAGAGIGAGGGRGGKGEAGTFAMNGNGVVYASSISDTSEKESGIIFIGNQGTVHGDFVLPKNFTITAAQTLTIPEESSLTIPEGITLTNNGKIINHFVKLINGGIIDGNGTIDGTPPITVTAPDAPTNVTAAASHFHVTVSFDAPANDGGNPITGYVVICECCGTETEGDNSPIIVENLQSHTDYTFTVKAINSVGISDASEPVTVKTLFLVPPTGIPGVTLYVLAMFAFVGISATLWVYTLRRKTR